MFERAGVLGDRREDNLLGGTQFRGGVAQRAAVHRDRSKDQLSVPSHPFRRVLQRGSTEFGTTHALQRAPPASRLRRTNSVT